MKGRGFHTLEKYGIKMIGYLRVSMDSDRDIHVKVK
jgi:hypothetical protein